MKEGSIISLLTDKKLYCGTSNVELPVPNKSYFPADYKEKSRLCYYASLFNSVEINRSFYKIPLRRTVERWLSEVPENFRFTFKLWKGITHAKELMYNPVDLGIFMNAISAADGKKGALLIQFPASIKFSHFRKMKTLFAQLAGLSETQYWKLAVEFRDKSWYNETTYELLENHNAAIVIHDKPKSAPPLLISETDHIYLRFHGQNGDYGGSYDDDYLKEQCELISDHIRAGKTVFAYFNNTKGKAVQNALDLQEMLRLSSK